MLHINDTTLLILNYERPGNLIKICERFQGFMPIEIINNNPAYRVPKNFFGASIINNKENRFYIERWYRTIRCKTPYVCLLDDDILPYKKTILEMRKNLIMNPTSLIGIHGFNGFRKATTYKDLKYNYCNNSTVEVVIGGCTLATVNSIRKIFQSFVVPMKRPVEGDDIIISLGLTKKFNNKHYTMEGELDILPGGEKNFSNNTDKICDRWDTYKKFERQFNI